MAATERTQYAPETTAVLRQFLSHVAHSVQYALHITIRLLAWGIHQVDGGDR